MRLGTKLGLPKEHGAWAMLYVPFVLGVSVAGHPTWRVVLLLFATTALFVSRESFVQWLRERRRGRGAPNPARRLVLYLAITAAAGSPLILGLRLLGLIPLGLIGVVLLVVNARQGVHREDRTVAGEALAVTGLTITAPASYYTTRGVWDTTALWLWALSFAFFVSSVLYVKLRVAGLNPRREDTRRGLSLHCVRYHAILLGVLLVASWAGGLPIVVLVAFLPVVARTLWAVAKPAARVNLARTGLLEILYSLAFLVCVSIGFRTV